MEATFAQKSETRKKSSAPEATVVAPLSPENALGTSAGMPLFLQRLPVNSVGSLLDLKDDTQLADPLRDADLKIGQPNDVYEQEADHIAQQATQLVSSTIPLQAATQKPRGIQRKASPEIASPEPATHAGQFHASGSGMPLSAKVREQVEPLLGKDLSHVQVHADASARETARRLQAKAFTHRNHIWLGENQDAEDVGLMSHEATHVVQQEGVESNSQSPLSTSAVPSIQRQFAPTSSVGESVASAASSATPVIPASFTPAMGDINSSVPDASATASTSPNQSIDPSLQAASPPPDSQADSSQASDAQTASTPPENTPADTAQDQRAADASTASATAEGDAATPQTPDLTTAQPSPPSGIEALGTGDIALIDEELAEHQRWQGALGRVGTAGSLGRAEFLAESAGGGLLNGFASGAAMGLGIGLAGRALKFVPYVGAIIGGGMALHGLAHRDWSNTAATIGNIGQGNSTYEVIANTLAAVAEAIDVVSNIMNVVAGITGVLAVACTVAAAALTAAALVTAGATLPFAAMAGEAAATLGEITLAISEVTNVMDIINSVILQPSILLFRALHTFTTEADPREVEAQGAGLGQAASTAGAFFGARAGGHLAEAGSGRSQTPGEEPLPHPEGSVHPEAPPAAASGDGPVVHFEAPPVSADASISSTIPTPIDAPTHIDSAPAAPVETPIAQSTPVAPVDAPVSSSSTSTATTPEVSPATSTPAISPVEAPAPHIDSAPVTPPIETPVGQSAHATPDAPTSSTQAASGEPQTSSTPPHEPLPEVRSDTFFEFPAGRDQGYNPDGTPIAPTHGLQSVEISTNPDPGKIQYHENMTFRGVREIRTADQRAVIPELVNGEVIIPSDRGTQTGVLTVPGNPHTTPPTPRVAGQAHTEGSVIPDPVAHSTSVPEVPFQPPGQQSSPNAGQPYPVQGRLHSSNPSPDLATKDPGAYSRFNPTVQINTVRKQGNQYFHPDGRFIDVTSPDIGPAHLPVGGRATSSPELPEGASISDYHLYGTRTEKGAPPIEIFGRPGVDSLADFDVDAAVSGLNPYLKPMSGSSEPPSSSTPPTPGNPPMPPTPTPGTTPVSSLAPETVTTSSSAATPVAISPTQTPSTSEAVTTPQPVTSTPISSEQPITSAPIASSSVEPTASQSPTSPVTPTPTSAIPVTPIPPVAPTTPGVGNTPTSTTSASGVRTPPPVIPSTLRQIGTMLLPQVFGPEGEPMTLAQRQAAHRAQFTADNQPSQGVERVNPQYPNPPGTPQQLAAIQLEIENVLAARARAEQAASQMSQQEAHHQAQQQPIQQSVQDAGAALSATQAHQQSVARHEQVNQAQQQRQQEAQTLVSGYPSRAAGIAVLTVPLAAFEGFTSLASHLPGSAGDKMSQMNQDSRKLQDAFAQMAANMATQAAAQPDRQASLQQDQARLQATNQQSVTTQQDCQTAQEGAQAMQQANEARLAEAQTAKTETESQQTDLTQAADKKQQQAQTLAQELQAWASAHKAARQAAIAETQQRLQGQGYIVQTSNQP